MRPVAYCDSTRNRGTHRLAKHQSPGETPRMNTDLQEAEVRSVRSMTLEQKLLVAQSLRSFAWELKRSVLERGHPEFTETFLLLDSSNSLGDPHQQPVRSNVECRTSESCR